MRTNIDIDDKLMRQAMRAMGAKTKRAAIDEALRKLVALDAYQKAIGEVFRRQEIKRQSAAREGRLDAWHEELVRKGNCPEFQDDADKRGNRR